MSRTRLKILIWLFLLVVFAAFGLFVLNRTAVLFVSFQEGADPASALNIVPNVPPDLKVRLDWLPDDADTGREMEPITRRGIESAYLRAWLQWNISYLRGEPYGLETYFVGPALEAVTEAVELAHQQGWSLAQTDLEHHLRLHFYAADGSIVSFTAHDVLIAQIMRDGTTAAPLYTGVTRADYDVIMMLEDGNWRVRHWVRREPADVNEPSQMTNNGFVTTNGRDLLLNDELFFVRGINYYPQDTPWHDFWPKYDESIIERDFELIHSLGLNTVRVFIPFAPEPFELMPEETADETESAEPELIDPYEHIREKLNHLLDTADEQNLKVIVTLFDFRTDYQILLWPNADRDLEEFVPYFADHPAILAWDLKNEPDLDQPGNTPEMVNAWLTHINQQVRRHDPNHLTTIGWAKIENATQLADVVDFVSFHYYEAAADLPDAYDTLRTAVPDKPIVLTEFGLSTWNSLFFPGGHTEAEQAAYYANILQTLAESDAAGFVAWTLYDFTTIPSSVVSSLPWRVAPQKQFGLINNEGEPKTAAFLLAADSRLEDVPQPTTLRRFLKPFWLTFFIAAVSSLAISWWLWRWYKKRSTA